MVSREERDRKVVDNAINYPVEGAALKGEGSPPAKKVSAVWDVSMLCESRQSISCDGRLQNQTPWARPVGKLKSDLRRSTFLR